MKKEKVYILLTDTGTMFTRMIKLYTRKPYNHASIAFDSNMFNVYSFGRKSSRNPFIGGFVKENIREDLFKEAVCAVFCFTVTKEQKRKMNQFIQEIEAKEHLYRYNFLGLFAIILNIQMKRDNTFFCSQFVATVLKESGSVKFSKPLSLMTPHDLEESPDFQLVYKGKLNDYINKATDRNMNMVCSDSKVVTV